MRLLIFRGGVMQRGGALVECAGKVDLASGIVRVGGSKVAHDARGSVLTGQ